MNRRPARIVLVGSIVADVIMRVSEIPERGTTIVAAGSSSRVGGGYPVLLAARRLGIPAALLGHIGTGPVATTIGAALAADGIEVLLPPVRGEQGFTVRLTEADGATTSITAKGVEADISIADLAGVMLRSDDVAYLSCLDLLDLDRGHAIAAWIDSSDGLGEATLILDPGPLVTDVDDDMLDTVLARTDVLSLDDRELALVSGAESDGDEALAEVMGMLADDAIVLLRQGGGRFVLLRSGHEPVHYPIEQGRTPSEFDDVDDLLAELARLGEVTETPIAFSG